MPLITETYYLSLTQDNRGILRLRCSQDDTLRTVNLKLYNNGSIFAIPSGISVSVSGVKQNGAVFSKPCTISQDRESVILQLSSDITNVDGIIVAEIVLSDGEGGRLGTSNFIIQVEKNPIRAGVVQDTETPIEYINDFIEKIQTLTARLNNLITPSGDPSLAEVVDARIGILDNTTYQTLGARLNAEFQRLGNALNGVTILESTGDTTDRTSEILSKLNAYGICKLGKGDFYVNSLIMPEDSMLVGSGKSTRVILSSSVTNGYVVKSRSNCIIENISFYGGFTGTYSELIASGNSAHRHCIILDRFDSISSENVILNNIFINNFVGSAIIQRYTVGCHCEDIIIDMCYAGVDISNASYDGQLINVSMSNTRFGVVQNGSNFVFTNCVSKDSAYHIMSDQQNTGCTFSSCSFSESSLETTSKLASISNAREGVTFDNCLFDSSLSMLLNACDGIVIKGTNFVGSDTFTITVSNGRNTLLLITDCIADVEPTVTNAGTAARITSCYLKDGTAWSISEADIDITVDDELSDESENPVQNKVINRAVSELKADLNNNPVLGTWFNNALNQNGYYMSDGTVSSSQNFKCGLVDISGTGATRLISYGNVNNTTAKVCFFDGNNTLISYDSIYSGFHEYTIPANTVYIGLSASNAAKNSFLLDTGLITDIQDTVTDIQDTVTDIQDTVTDIQDTVTDIQDTVTIDAGTMISGYFIRSTDGEAESMIDSDCTDFIDVPTGGICVIVFNGLARGGRAGIAEYDANKHFIQSQWHHDSENTSKTVTLDSKTAYVRITAAHGEVPSVNVSAKVNFEILQSAIRKNYEDVGRLLVADDTPLTDGYYQADGTVSSSANWKCTLVDISNRKDKTIYNIGSNAKNKTARICFFDANDNLLSSEPYNVSGTAYAIPQSTVTVGLSMRNADEQCNYAIKGELLLINGNETSNAVLYVAPNGDDNNSGLSKSAPLATVDQALSKGASTVLLAAGVYEQQIDLTRCKNGRLLLKRDGQNQDTITFVDRNRIICSSATLVSGKTKVYTAVANRTVDTNCIWIYQDGYADRSTLISDAERMPQERGYIYRCEDTKIDLCSSSTLADALNEIEGSDSYLWFYDSTNQTIYFSAPSNDFAQYPICSGRGAGLFSAISEVDITLIGIDVKYLDVNLVGVTGARLSNCKCLNAYSSGAFHYNYGIDITFEHCEAARACNSRSFGDGFNAHGANANLSIPARNCSAKLIDCWSHDNCDDGFSDHERAESLIIGGLYEYNGDGVTPSSGAHCACYGVYSRNNKHGIYYTIASGASDRGVGGQVYCVDCVAENNSVVGFLVDASNNKMVLNNCKSIGNVIGYQVAQNNEMILIDCGSLNDRTIKSGSGILTIKNTTTVE